MKRLYRSTTNKMISGVCGVIAEYFNIGPTIVRIIWAILSLYHGMRVLMYITAALIIPEDNGIVDES